MSKKIVTLLTMVVVLMVIAACGGGDTAGSGGDSGGQAAGSGEESLKVILLINGVLGDKSFFDSAQRGMDRAEKELGVQTKTIETKPDDPALWEATLIDAAANEEYDIFIVGTWQMIQCLHDVAPKYPDKKFIFYIANVDYEAC